VELAKIAEYLCDRHGLTKASRRRQTHQRKLSNVEAMDL
jgi:hypothetical protein